MPDPLITMRRMESADQRWMAAIDDSVFAPPDAGFANRVRAIAAAAESEATVMHEAARIPRLRWTPGTSKAVGLSYELRPGGNRPGPVRSWEQFDQAVQQLADAQAGDDFAQIGDAFRQLAKIAMRLAGEIDHERETIPRPSQANAG